MEYNIDTNNLIIMCYKINEIEEFISKYEIPYLVLYNNDLLHKYKICPNNLEYFVKEIIPHKDQINLIIHNLEKIRDLGFKEFNISKKYRFNSYTYDLPVNKKEIYLLNYFDNIEVYPSYQDYIKYKTTSSNYKIECFLAINTIIKSKSELYIKDILGNFESFPKELKFENIMQELLTKKEMLGRSNIAINNSVDLNIKYMYLYEEFIKYRKLITKMEQLNNKKEFIKALKILKNNLQIIKDLISNYENTIIDNNLNIDKELLDSEKQLYLEKNI